MFGYIHTYIYIYQPDTDHYFQMIIHDRKKHWVPVIRKKTPYWIEHGISKAQHVVSRLDLGWHLSSKKNPWGPFLEEWLDFHFEGAALHKTDSLTVFITYLFAVCFTILLYFTIFTLLLLTDTPRLTPINWKPTLILATASKRTPTIEWKTESGWSGKTGPARP